jgi:hypothetical protein
LVPCIIKRKGYEKAGCRQTQCQEEPTERVAIQ